MLSNRLDSLITEITDFLSAGVDANGSPTGKSRFLPNTTEIMSPVMNDIHHCLVGFYLLSPNFELKEYQGGGMQVLNYCGMDICKLSAYSTQETMQIDVAYQGSARRFASPELYKPDGVANPGYAIARMVAVDIAPEIGPAHTLEILKYTWAGSDRDDVTERELFNQWAVASILSTRWRAVADYQCNYPKAL